MLYWGWSLALLALGMAFAFEAGRNDKYAMAIESIFFHFFAFGMVLNDFVLPAFVWLCKTLPNQGETINVTTAWLLIVLFVSAFSLSSAAFFYRLGERSVTKIYSHEHAAGQYAFDASLNAGAGLEYENLAHHLDGLARAGFKFNFDKAAKVAQRLVAEHKAE